MSGLFSPLAFALPALTGIAWVVSWRGRGWLRWAVLAASFLVSACCIAYGFAARGPQPVGPVNPANCASGLDCGSGAGMSWLAAGALDAALLIVLLVVTVAIEFVRLAGGHVKNGRRGLR